VLCQPVVSLIDEGGTCVGLQWPAAVFYREPGSFRYRKTCPETDRMEGFTSILAYIELHIYKARLRLVLK